MQKLILNLITFYQQHLSFDSGLGKFLIVGPYSCRYSPTCSEYSKQAIKKYGILRGVFLGIKRILSCNPFAKGGYDPLR